jgi:hypothetical protein
MMFAVFVGFYLAADHAPWWVWALATGGFLWDYYETRRDAKASYARFLILVDSIGRVTFRRG